MVTKPQTTGVPPVPFTDDYVCPDPEPRDMNNRVKPDLLVAFDVEAASILPRNGYIIWEVGKLPDFVMEAASESTRRRDTGFKRDLYAGLGIAKYWRVDPTGNDYYGCAGVEVT